MNKKGLLSAISSLHAIVLTSLFFWKRLELFLKNIRLFILKLKISVESLKLWKENVFYSEE